MNLDKTFNPISGFVKTFDTSGDKFIGVSVAIRSDKRIVMGGYQLLSELGFDRNRIVLVCYNQDGSLHSGFGSTSLGKTIEPFRDGYDENIVNDIALLPDNSIIVTGTMRLIAGGINHMFAAKFLPNGSIDTNFGIPEILSSTDGFALTAPSAFDSSGVWDNCYSNSVAITTDGKIVMGGYVHRFDSVPPIDYVALVKYTTTGHFDGNFNSGGSTPGCDYYKADPAADEACTNIKLKADGSIVVGCVSTKQVPGSLARFMVFRTDTNGVQDTSFNSTGTPGYNIITNFSSGSSDYSTGLGINSSGDILIGGTVTVVASPSPNTYYGIACLASDGTTKNAFGTTGKTSLNLTGVSINVVSPNLAAAHSLAMQSDDKIVIACGCESTVTNNVGFLLARFKADGQPDTTFSVTNQEYIVSDLVPSPREDIGYSVKIQNDGKILVGGTTSYTPDAAPAEYYFTLARYAENLPPVVVPICFPAGTPVLTDQGYIEIDKIDPTTNTIRGHSIIAITKTISSDNKLVCFERGSLGHNVPNRTTYVSLYHGIIYKNKLVESRKFVNKIRGVYFVKYNRKHLYNVLLRKHVHMVVNNMKVETLNPTNIVSKLYLNDYNIADKIKLILKINEFSKRNNDAKNRMTINYNKTNYAVHRFNPKYNNIIFTRRHNMRNQVAKVSYNNKITPSTAIATATATAANSSNIDAATAAAANSSNIDATASTATSTAANSSNIDATASTATSTATNSSNIATATATNSANIYAAATAANFANQKTAIANHTKTLKNLIRLRSFWTHRNPHNKGVNANRYFNRRRW